MKEQLARVLRGPIRLYNEGLIHKLYNKKFSLKPIAEKEKNLVLVPHVDDETIGMGAYLLKSSKEHILCYSTDSGGSLSAHNYEDTVKERSREALRIAKELNIKRVEFLGVGEDRFIEEAELKKEKLKQIIIEEQFDRIFTVSPYDAHPIHRQTTGLLLSMIDDIPEHCRIVFYEVSNLMPAHWVNSYAAMNRELFLRKRNLYSFFPSQDKTMDFDIFQRLNRRKGKVLENGSYAAEYFCDLSKEEFKERMESLSELDLPKYRIGNHRSFRKTV